jgi:hypothetical protein
LQTSARARWTAHQRHKNPAVVTDVLLAMLDALEQSKGGGGDHSDLRRGHQRNTPAFCVVCDRLRPWDLAVGMPGEEKWVGDSILVRSGG